MSTIVNSKACYVDLRIHIMRKYALTLSSSTLGALNTLGAMIKAARLERGMSQAELGERLGISRHTVIALEKGAPKVSVGTVFEAAHIVGIPLLANDQREFNKLATLVASLTSILPERRGRGKVVLDDNF